MDINQKLYYPTRYDLNHTLLDFCQRKFADAFAQSKGLFLTKSIHAELAEQLSMLNFDDSDLELIRDHAYKVNSIGALSGFIVTSKEEGFDPAAALDALRSNGKILSEMKLSPITKEIDSEGNEIFRGKVEYIDAKPGRIEFLQKEERNFTFSIQRIESDSFEILVEGTKSNDSKIFETLITRHGGKEIRLDTLNQDMLSAKQTIAFFDELIKKGMSSDWTFLDVKQLIFRRGKDEDEVLDEMDDAEEATEAVLSGIKQAILNGNRLRENSFVKQSEESGYRFAAMIYQYEHKTKPYLIQIGVEFKGRPKVFEVTIKNYKTREGVGEHFAVSTLGSDKATEIKLMMWKKAKEVFKSLTISVESH